MESQPQQQTQPGRIMLAYESLFGMVVREKSHEELQRLSQNFFTDLIGYLNEKRGTLSLLGAEEKEKTARQLQNINRLIKELYERREKKIIGLALARSRAGVDIIDTSMLLAEEKAMFDSLVKQLDFYRDAVLNNLLVAKLPDVSQQKFSEQSTITAAAAEKPPERSEQQTQSSETSATKLVRLLHPVPRFVGKELEVYGPFDHEDIANLPREIADVLIAKGRAEEMAQA